MFEKLTMDEKKVFGKNNYSREYENYEKKALEQLYGYLESKRQDMGYLVSFSFNKNKEYTKVWKKYKDKKVYAVVV